MTICDFHMGAYRSFVVAMAHEDRRVQRRLLDGFLGQRSSILDDPEAIADLSFALFADEEMQGNPMRGLSHFECSNSECPHASPQLALADRGYWYSATARTAALVESLRTSPSLYYGVLYCLVRSAKPGFASERNAAKRSSCDEAQGEDKP